MRYDVIGLVAGWSLILLTVPLLISGGIGYIMNDEMSIILWSFLPPIIFCIIVGLIFIRLGTRRDTADRLRDREAFAAVALSWPLIVAVGALPYWFGPTFHGPITWDGDGGTLYEIMGGLIRGWFESMSGFTTSGATTIDPYVSPRCEGVEDCIASQPYGILFWRSSTQWLGGMGIIMLGMLLLSRALGGGMSIARAELTGPSLSRLRPRLQETAKALWGIYIGFTVLEFILLMWWADIGWFNAINYSLTTMPSGGFGTTDAGIMAFNSPLVEGIITFFMVATGINFTLFHFLLLKEYAKVINDQELRVYIIVLAGAWAVFALNLVHGAGWDWGDAIRHGAFQAAAIGTSTGYASADFASWPVLSLFVLLFLMVVGASAGSTSGGLKILRLRLAFVLARREIHRMVQPRAVISVRMNGEVVDDSRMWVVIGMLSTWAALAMVSLVVLAIFEPTHSLETILSVIFAALGNTGPALGAFGPTSTWAGLNWYSLLYTSVLMWAGRLELLTVLVLFHPRTWRKETKS
ncbi:MAG TPA: TrkH family potassium uptake protein [Candidatus Thalassarchaeaceae archaeon]|jgi:trk system potassium uptake protein TrkH|nr:TrkH family potassium uptake protein [Candidatus Thalassarchaeaceae archaeon]HJM67365.1 TrkH family potassium uptake protein [Candidatus Thalassarchaeaceae archaeon]